MNPLQQIITVQEAAAIMKISERAIRQHCEKGNYTARKSGGTWLIDSKCLKPSK